MYLIFMPIFAGYLTAFFADVRMSINFLRLSLLWTIMLPLVLWNYADTY